MSNLHVLALCKPAAPALPVLILTEQLHSTLLASFSFCSIVNTSVRTVKSDTLPLLPHTHSSSLVFSSQVSVLCISSMGSMCSHVCSLHTGSSVCLLWQPMGLQSSTEVYDKPYGQCWRNKNMIKM